jgi:predicted NBD/HSP70 family sugar kinase
MTTGAGTPAWLATQNDRTAFRLLLANGPLSRSQLGELAGASKPTAGQMIARLERIGLIGPVGEVSGARGPNAVSYGARQDSLTGVAISILDDRIEAVLVDPTDADHPVTVLPTAGRLRSPAADEVAAVAAACGVAGVPRDSVSAVAVGVQAAFDDAADELSFTDTLPGWPQQGARGEIERATGLAVILENDVNLATMAERAAGTAGGDFAYLWLGKGIGAGVDIDGGVQRGASGGAGELGYLEVPRSAAAIDPAATDFTDLLGGPAVVALLGGVPDQEDLDLALQRLPGNASALAALAERIALLLQPLVAVLDPPCIVLGGPTGRAGGEQLAGLVADLVNGRDPRIPRSIRTTQVTGPASGAGPVLLGARRLLVATIRERLEAAITA